MRRVLLLPVCCLAIGLAAAGTSPSAISIREDGTLVIEGSVEVPRVPAEGQWTEMAGRSSARWVIRHFMFMVAGGTPAMELYISHDLADEPPDGAFEIGLVSGFLRGFSSQGGFRADAPRFEDAAVGSARVKRCWVELSKGERKIWLYAYIFVRRPSLTFLTLRPRPDASESIEEYLRGLRLR